MTLAESYSLGTGVALSRPEIADAFFPLAGPIDKAILIHAFAGAIAEQNGQRMATFPAKVFSYYAEVVALLKPILEPRGYHFIQIGTAGEPPLKGVTCLCGQTTIHQCAYLVKNAALLLGNDSMWAHVRGVYGGPLVALYGPTSKPHFPYWRDESKTVLIESHRKGNKPSYASQENPKTIDWISPESVANAVLLQLLPSCPPTDARLQVTRQSLYIGPNYNESIIEVVPNVAVPASLQTAMPPVVRMDYLHDENGLAANLRQRKCSIILDQPVDLNLLSQLKPHIAGMRVEIDRIETEWLRKFMRLGIPTGFFVTGTDEDKIRDRRLELLDILRFDTYVHPTKEDLKKFAAIYMNREIPSDLDWSKVHFKTNKLILSDGKLFLSKPHWLAGQSIVDADQNTGLVIDDPLFYVEQAHMYFFTQ